jgi:3-methyladenine DNA glycosylase AlkD
MEAEQLIKRLKSLRNEKSLEGMARFGINTTNAFGISMVELRKIAKEYGKNQALAENLWQAAYHETRILATLIAENKKITSGLMDSWVKDFDSWDVCDQCCGNLFRYTTFAYDKAIEWTSSNHEFTKRAGFTLMACLATGDKKANDEKFLQFFPLIIKHANDERNFVRKAVNWALRQIGKRSHFLRTVALKCIDELLKNNNKTAQWIAKDALRELNEEKIIKRIKK